MKLVLAVMLALGVSVASAVMPQQSVKIEGEFGVYTLPSVFYTQATSKSLDEDLNLFIDSLCKKEYVAPKDATLIFDACLQKVIVTQEKPGCAVDKQALKGLIWDAIELGGVVKIPKTTVEPTIKAQSLISATYLRAEFTTYYLAERIERAGNIALATKTINGTVVLPNQVFSFNKVVGERTEERGYKIAKVIKGGTFADGIGGGVCQVSTTLYNAVLLAGLKVTEVHRHTLAVDYVKRSFDAMVSFGFADLKFVNDTSHPILIVGWVKNGLVGFSVYGCEKTVDIKLESVTTKRIEPKTNVIFNPSLDSGVTKVVVSPKPGYESQGYLIIDDGTTTVKKLIRRDTYKCVDGIIETGGE